MALQRAAGWIAAGVAGLLAGCAAPEPHRPAPYQLVATGSADSNVRAYQSAHYTLFTTLSDVDRVGPIIDTLETAYDAYVAATEVRPAEDAPRMNVYVFQRRVEWEAFTIAQTGAQAQTYLKLQRGGYSFGNACALVDQGDRDTRSTLAHEGFHLFVTTRFIARPPPFIEEGLAVTFEGLLDENGIVHPVSDRRTRRSHFGADDARHRPLRQLLGMHAGNVLAQSPADVEAFYSDAWMFVRFCRDGENGRYASGFARLMQDAAAGRLSSDDLSGDPAMVERYLGASLDEIQPQFVRFRRQMDSSVGEMSAS